jgi:hypothetical protein
MYEIMEKELLRAIESYLRETGEASTAFGKRVAGDSHLVLDLRNGRSVGMKMRRRIEAALITTQRKRAS